MGKSLTAIKAELKDQQGEAAAQQVEMRARHEKMTKLLADCIQRPEGADKFIRVSMGGDRTMNVDFEKMMTQDPDNGDAEGRLKCTYDRLGLKWWFWHPTHNSWKKCW